MIYRVIAYPRPIEQQRQRLIAKADTTSVTLARATQRLWRREGFAVEIYNVEEERVA
jgi:hypothetical protein